MKLTASIAHLPGRCRAQWDHYTTRNDLDSMLDVLVHWSEYRDVLLASIGRAALRGMVKIDGFRSQGKTRQDAVDSAAVIVSEFRPWHTELAGAARFIRYTSFST